jgi:tetratricopeptide (TPR) repeat protein
VFEEEGGRFWGNLSTRPYMRARLGLAQCLQELGKTEEAIDHYRALLRLNPNDNQGVRDLLLPVLFATDRDEEAGGLLKQYEEDVSALWRYGWALWAFRHEGDSAAARERLREALKANRRVPKYLLGEAEWPDTDPASYALGSEEEAVLSARALDKVWQSTMGADQWLKGRVDTKKGHKRRRR